MITVKPPITVLQNNGTVQLPLTLWEHPYKVRGFAVKYQLGGPELLLKKSFMSLSVFSSRIPHY
jgi:hypothetical protein